MFKSRTGLLSMEDADVVEGALPEEAAEAVAEVTEVNDAVAEDVAEGAAIAADTVDLEDAIEEIQGLETIAEGVEEKVESGEGLSEDAGELLEVAVESACRRLGIKRSSRLSKENYATGSKLAASRLSLEGIKETIVKAWEAVKNFFKGMWVRIKEFFARIFTNLPKLRKQVIAMRDRAYQIKGTTKASDKIKTSAAQFSVEGKANKDTASAILKNYYQFLKALPEAFDAFGKGVTDAAAAVKGTKSVDFTALSNALIAPLGKMDVSRTGKKPAENGDQRFEGDMYGPLLGGQALFVGKSYHKDAKKEDKAEAAPYMDLVDVKQTVASDIEALDAKNVQALADACLMVLDAAEEVDRKKSKVEAALNSGVKAAEEVIKSAQVALEDKADASEARKNLSDARTWVTKAGSLANRMVVMAPSMGAQAVKAALAYGNASLSNLKAA